MLEFVYEKESGNPLAGSEIDDADIVPLLANTAALPGAKNKTGLLLA